MSDRPNKLRGPFGMLVDAFRRYPRRTILVLALLMIWPTVMGIAWVSWWMARGRKVFEKRRQSSRSSSYAP